MIILRNADEIELLRQAGRIVALTHRELKQHIRVGITTKQLDEIAERTIRHYGATPSFKGYGGFPASICTSINQVLVHGIPDDTPLRDGDIISIDIGACYQGYHGDSAWSYAVGTISSEAQRLMDVTEQSLYQGLSQANPGQRLTDISHAIQNYVESQGFSIPIDYTGHGVGRQLHEEPIVPNVGLAGRGPILKPGLVIAVEPMVHYGHCDTVTLIDGWTVKTKDESLAAHFEHTIVITPTGYEILTTL